MVFFFLSPVWDEFSWILTAAAADACDKGWVIRVFSSVIVTIG